MPTVEDVLMTTGPEVVVSPANTTVSVAATMMADACCGSVIIMDDSKIAGIFTERDLLKKVIAKGLEPTTTTMSEVMSSPVLSCTLDDDIDLCWDKMSENRIRHIAVVENDALVGVIGLRDILNIHARCNHPNGRLCDPQPWPRADSEAPKANQPVKVIEL